MRGVQRLLKQQRVAGESTRELVDLRQRFAGEYGGQTMPAGVLSRAPFARGSPCPVLLRALRRLAAICRSLAILYSAASERQSSDSFSAIMRFETSRALRANGA